MTTRHNRSFDADMHRQGVARRSNSMLGSMKLIQAAVVGIAGIAWQIAAVAAGPSLGLPEKVRITEQGADQSGDWCSTFNVSPRAAASLLARARIVSLRELHDHFDSAPCYVRGTAMFGGEAVRWELRALGTGSIEFVATDEVIHFVTRKPDVQR